MNKPEKSAQLEVLSPWSETDPVTIGSPADRLDSLAGKKIGLFCNYKRSAGPMLATVEQWLQQQFPDIELSTYHQQAPSVPEMESTASEQFVDWIDEMDGVVLAVGD
jgi:hypothetical protein